MPTDILALSWTVQVALASGYAAYIVGYRGIRAHHTAQDTLFLSLVFSLFASGALWLCQNVPPPLAGFWAFVSAIVAGLVWRRYGMNLLTRFLRGPDTTWADDTPSAWSRLQENRQYPVSQISVLLKSGTWLNCDDTTRFDDAPYSPCILGTNGDVLMYLTSTTSPDGSDKNQPTVIDPTYGCRLTYVPSAEIARVNIRLLPPSVVPRRRRLSFLSWLRGRFRLGAGTNTAGV